MFAFNYLFLNKKTPAKLDFIDFMYFLFSTQINMFCFCSSIRDIELAHDNKLTYVFFSKTKLKKGIVCVQDTK